MWRRRSAAAKAVVPMAAMLVLVVAGYARAHSEPIFPSVCTLEPFALTAPGAGLAGTAAAPGPADVLRQVYDAESSSVTFCPADALDPTHKCATTISPRGFTMGTVSGTIAFPASFIVSMLATGDLTVADLPLSIDAGGGPVAVSTLLTTGLVSSAGGAVLEGSPIDTGGHVAFVGSAVGTGLPAPLADQPLGFRMSCTLDPPPDLDQFALTPTIAKTTGRVAANGAAAKLTVTLEPGQTPDFAGKPALLRLYAGDTTVGSVDVPGGLTAAGKKKFHGTAADGAEITVAVKSTKRYVLTAHCPAATLPPGAHGKVTIAVTEDVGGYLARGTRSFKANRKGTILKAR
jgi:hypothetical protein